MATINSKKIKVEPKDSDDDRDLTTEEMKKRSKEEKEEFDRGLARLGWRGSKEYRDVVLAIFSGKDLPLMRAPEEQGIVEQVAVVVRKLNF